MVKCKGFTLQFKVRALNLLDENENNILQTEHELRSEGSNLYTWIKKRVTIIEAVKKIDIDSQKKREL